MNRIAQRLGSGQGTGDSVGAGYAGHHPVTATDARQSAVPVQIGRCRADTMQWGEPSPGANVAGGVSPARVQMWDGRARASEMQRGRGVCGNNSFTYERQWPCSTAWIMEYDMAPVLTCPSWHRGALQRIRQQHDPVAGERRRTEEHTTGKCWSVGARGPC